MERETLKLALEALQLVSIEWVCNGAHHAKKDRHQLDESCPIVERYQEAIVKVKAALEPPVQEPWPDEPVGHMAGGVIPSKMTKGNAVTELYALFDAPHNADINLARLNRMLDELISSAQPAQEPDMLTIAYQSGYHDGKKAALAGREWNFCERCGKRTPDTATIHTCTPPQGGA